MNNVLGKMNSGAARRIFLVDVVRLLHSHMIAILRIHQFGQKPVDSKEDINANAEV